MKRLGHGALIAVAILTMGLEQTAHAFASKDLGFVNDTHNQLTTNAAKDVSGVNYPDIPQYQGAIISGGSDVSPEI